jgi:hypothetical protein
MTPHRPSALAGASLALLGAAALVGCPPGLSDPARFQAACPPDYSVESMLRDRCAGNGCHGGAGAPAADLDLVTAGAFARMYGHPSAACGELLVSPQGPDHSLLVHKLDGSSTCGARMPLGTDPLAPTDLACVRAWVTNGADGGTVPVMDAGKDAATDAGEKVDAGAGGGGAGGGGAGGGGAGTGGAGTGGAGTGGAGTGGAG